METNSDIEDVDSITDVVQHQPHQHIPHLELIETGPTGNPRQRQYINRCWGRKQGRQHPVVGNSSSQSKTQQLNEIKLEELTAKHTGLLKMTKKNVLVQGGGGVDEPAVLGSPDVVHGFVMATFHMYDFNIKM